MFLLLLLGFLGLAAQPSDGSLERALEKMGRLDYVGALADLEALAARAPRPAAALYYQIGVCQEILGRHTEAVRSFERARGAGARTWEIQGGLGMAYFHLGDNTRARSEFEHVLRGQPDEPTALFYLGRIDMKERRYVEAERRFRRVLELQPGDPAALFQLGRVLVLEGKTAEGEKLLEYQRRLVHNRDSLKTLLDLAASPQAPAEIFAEIGNVYLELGERAKALEALERAEKLRAGSAALGLGKAKYYTGDFAAAEEDLRRHLEAEPKDCEGQLFLGLTLKEERKYAAAREALERALALCPERTDLLGGLAEAEIQLEHLDRALALAERIVARDPLSAVGPHLLAVCRFYRNDLDGAESWALRAVERDPQNAEYHRLLRAVYLKKGDAEKARLHEKEMERLLGKPRG